MIDFFYVNFLVRSRGFEPPTPGLGILCSILLSYERFLRILKDFPSLR